MLKTMMAPAPIAEPIRPVVPPKKLFYKINEVAQLTGLKPHVLRYWETEFRELSPAKDAADQRRYRWADIEVVLAIRKLLYEERFTIEGARKRLRDELRRRREEPAPAPPESHVARPAASRKKEDVASRRLDRSLKGLRSEVSELLKMLGA